MAAFLARTESITQDTSELLVDAEDFDRHVYLHLVTGNHFYLGFTTAEVDASNEGFNSSGMFDFILPADEQLHVRAPSTNGIDLAVLVTNG